MERQARFKQYHFRSDAYIPGTRVHRHLLSESPTSMPLRAFRTVAAIIGVSLAVPSTLSAQYIDPGSSSLLWQLLLTGLVGASFTFRRAFTDIARRIRARRDGGKAAHNRTNSNSEGGTEHRTEE